MKTLCDILDRIRRDARPDLLRVRRAGADRFESISAASFLADIDRCAGALAQSGIARGDRVGLVCGNRPEWHVIDFACHRLGAVLVPVFSTLSAKQVTYCFGDSGCKVVVVEGQEQLRKLAGVASALPDLECLVVIGVPVAGTALGAIEYDAFLTEAAGEGSDLPGPASGDDLATIIYTSGTTGTPKGVMLSHRNLISNVEGLQALEPLGPDDVGLSVLPLCHVYERTADYQYFAVGCRVAYGNPNDLSRDFGLVRPTVMIGVPRLYQKLRGAIEAHVANESRVGRLVYRLALRVGMRRARARRGLEREALSNRLLYPAVESVVLRKIRAVTGGRIRIFSAGGAAVDASLNWWFVALGWEMLQGYGLTECSPVVSGNSIDDNRIGSVGRPLAGVQVRIDADGEIVVRGPNVMLGYWRQPEATQEALIEGWLRTGDIGEIDADGFLWVTDRKKAILVTSTGENVAPGPLENALENSPYIEQSIVVGDGRRFIAALVVPAYRKLERWAAARGLPTSRIEMSTEPAVIALIETEIARVQADFAPYQQVRAFRILERPLTLDAGHLTPTMKLVRHRIIEGHADLIEGIYAE